VGAIGCLSDRPAFAPIAIVAVALALAASGGSRSRSSLVLRGVDIQETTNHALVLRVVLSSFPFEEVHAALA